MRALEVWMRPVASTRDSPNLPPDDAPWSIEPSWRLPWWLQKRRPTRRSRLLLAEMHAFAGCSRAQLSRIARWGDVIETGPGEVLVREDHTDFWFFVVMAGSVRVSRQGRAVASLHRGDHFGEVAIIGFRPQPATVTAVEPTVLFVLGRRYLLSLAALDQSIRRALFPNVAPDDYSAFVREQQEQGLRHWERLVPREQLRSRYAGGKAVPAPRPRRPGRTLSWSDAVDVLSRHELSRVPHVAAPIESPVSKKRFRLVLTAFITALVAAVSLIYHPPIAVVTSGRPIDVVQDISITGVRVDPPTGRYLLTTVNVSRPTLAGMLVARARGRRVVRANSPGARQLDVATARRLAHEAFLSSHRQAIALAEEMLGVDAPRLSIAIRDRGIDGPSAGLIYALAITDMLAPDDLAAGRVIAATGELRPDGGVDPVAFVSLKADAARDGGAVVFLVPAGQHDQARGTGLSIRGVANLEEAVQALRDTR